MLSIARYMTADDIAEEIRMERMVHSGSFLLVEGKTDVDRLSDFIDGEACSIVNCWGRRKAINALRKMTGRKRSGVVVMIDADFDRINGCLLKDPSVIYSTRHDFDMDWLDERRLEKYLRQVGDSMKVNGEGGAWAVLEKILQGLKRISAARYLNDTKKIPFKVSNIRASDHFDNFNVNLDSYVDALTDGSDLSVNEVEALKKQIEETSKLQFDLMQFTNGHDVHCALGKSLQSNLGSRKGAHTFGSEVELHIRLIYSEHDFLESDVFRNLTAWEARNQNFKVLRQELRSQVPLQN
ncbi:DUF4435 domain-containing protein [Brucella intermedia]|uniref:DUF4435 domain-containing protein n=1 Tax=Brucella intermedia TaxID=94625 RepID=UPI002735CB52|nr:DUF4435 domain-containing protein [Brucella intermedia]WLF96470.1 DUF4435 domain-containing protein [Brucella intermedia]